MFVSVSPVCPVTDIKRSIAFWQMLGFELAFVDTSAPTAASYVGVRREGLSIHLQTFTPDQIATTQSMALRVWMESKEAQNALYAEWEPHGIISAKLSEHPWGNREFGFYDPDKTPFFFCVDA